MEINDQNRGAVLKILLDEIDEDIVTLELLIAEHGKRLQEKYSDRVRIKSIDISYEPNDESVHPDDRNSFACVVWADIKF